MNALNGDVWSGLVWFLGGLAVGLVHTASVVLTVGRLQPGQIRHGRRLMWRGYAFRGVLIALALVVAVRRGIWSGLWLAGGLWVSRWVPVYLGRSCIIDWSWFDSSLKE